MKYMRRLRIKGAPFFRLEHYLKQLGFHELKYREGQGKLSFTKIVTDKGISKYLTQPNEKRCSVSSLIRHVEGVPFSMEGITERVTSSVKHFI